MIPTFNHLGWWTNMVDEGKKTIIWLTSFFCGHFWMITNTVVGPKKGVQTSNVYKRAPKDAAKYYCKITARRSCVMCICMYIGFKFMLENCGGKNRLKTLIWLNFSSDWVDTWPTIQLRLYNCAASEQKNQREVITQNTLL